MIDVLDIVLPIYILGFLGYFATRWNYFKAQHAEILTQFVFNIAAPIMVLQLLNSTVLPKEIPWGLFGSFYIPVFIVYFLMLFISRVCYGDNLKPRIISAMGSSFGNMFLIGLPLIIRTFGDDGALIFFLLFTIHDISILIVSNMLLVYSDSKGANYRSIKTLLAGVIKNPILMALFLGLLLNYFDIKLPVILDDATAIMGGAMVPVALFALGAIMTNFSVRHVDLIQILIISMKMLVCPCLVWIFSTYVFGLGDLERAVCVLIAAMPCALLYQVIAERYKIEATMAASTVFISSIISIFTLSGLLYVFTR